MSESSIINDAEELLVFLYKEYLKPDFLYIDGEKLKIITKWSSDRLARAISHLYNEEFISLEGDKRFFQGFIVRGLLPDGTKTIERPKQFKKHFEHEIDLKFYKFSWGATEK